MAVVFGIFLHGLTEKIAAKKDVAIQKAEENALGELCE